MLTTRLLSPAIHENRGAFWTPRRLRVQYPTRKQIERKQSKCLRSIADILESSGHFRGDRQHPL